jgi:hypothetical protein
MEWKWYRKGNEHMEGENPGRQKKEGDLEGDSVDHEIESLSEVILNEKSRFCGID